MEEKAFSSAILQDIKNILYELKFANTKSESAAKNLKTLIATIDRYEIDNSVSHSEIYNDLHSIIDSLSGISGGQITQVTNLAKEACRACIFHTDDCFINLIFLIFKSVELGKYVEPNKTRPTMRVVHATK